MRHLACVLIAILPTMAFGQAGKPAPIPADLALVPNDAFIVAHLKVAEIWKHDAMKEVRALLEKAGSKALKNFNARYTPMPSTVERVTAFMPVPSLKESGVAPKIVCLVTLSQPVERQALLKQFADKPTAVKGKFGEYYVDDDDLMAVRFLDDKMIAFGTADGLQYMVDTALPKKAGPLTPAIELASGNRPIVVGINTNFIPQDLLDTALQDVPEALHPLFKAKCVNLSADLEGKGSINAEVMYSDKQYADEAEKALEAGIKIAKDQLNNFRAMLEERLFAEGKPAKWTDFAEAAASLAGLGGLKHLEDILDGKPLKRNGNTYSLTIPLPPHFNTLVGSAALAASAGMPSVGEIQVAANRMKSANNLKQIALAMHNYHDTMGTFPPAAICDKKGKPLLSWRVSILPYIEEDALYREFKLDEPWDSDHNKKLIERMPKIYAMPGYKKGKPNMAYYRVFSGNGALFDVVKGVSFANITDGTSNTIMAVEAEEGVIWSKPDDFEFDPAKDLPKLGKFFKGGFNAGFADGSVRFINKSVDHKTIKALITRDGGEVTTLP